MDSTIRPDVAASRAEAAAPSEVLTDELRRYEYEYTGGGRLTYSAPSGFHDDCVIALALASSLGREHASEAPAPHLKAPAIVGRCRGQARALA